jgi:hypothetical protein
MLKKFEAKCKRCRKEFCRKRTAQDYCSARCRNAAWSCTKKRRLKLKNQNEWRAYCRGERKDLPPKPNDIPAHPYRTYGEDFREKGGWGAWLGTANVSRGVGVEARRSTSPYPLD